MSLKARFLLYHRLSKLPSSFKFYKVILNNSYYILGINYLTSNSVRKIPLSLSDVLLEYIVDTVLLNGKTIKNPFKDRYNGSLDYWVRSTLK